MKKTITILGIFLAVVFLSGCGQKTAQNENQNLTAENAKTEESQNDKSVISSIKDAISLGKKMKCVYKSEINGQVFESESFIDGKNHKTVTTINGQKNYSILDGDMIYTWSEADKKGTKMSMKCIESLKEENESNPQSPASNLEDIKSDAEDFDDATDVNCEPVGSVDFSVPNDVVFTDTCETMKKSLEMINQYKNQARPQAPGAGLPGQEPTL